MLTEIHINQRHGDRFFDEVGILLALAMAQKQFWRLTQLLPMVNVCENHSLPL